MPRLLLVDDNESIHKIAETLLASTDIDLVCAKSGKEAIHLVEQGSAFDAALLDTAMAEMDGWALLEHLRQMPSTMDLPIAMMAGVLDTVDPMRIAHAPIQGFIKKPVELRDLGERVHKLIKTTFTRPAREAIPAQANTENVLHEPISEPILAPTPATVPVPGPMPPPAPSGIMDFGTLGEETLAGTVAMPDPIRATADLAEELRAALAASAPETEKLTPGAFLPPAGAATGNFAQVPEELQTVDLDADLEMAPDVLVLTAQDLIEEGSVPGTGTEELSPFTEIPHIEETLELEDLDLEALHEIPDTLPMAHDLKSDIKAAAMNELAAEPAPAVAKAAEDFPELDAESLGTPMIMEQHARPVRAATPEQGFEMATPVDELLSPMIEQEKPLVLGAQAEQPEMEELPPLIAMAPPLPAQSAIEVEAPIPATVLESATAIATISEPLPALIPSLAPQSSPPQAAPPPQIQAQEIVKAILADPKLMDQLAKALASRLSENSLKEIAWEVMPELVERFQNK